MAGNQNSGRPPKPSIVHLVNGNPSKKARSELDDSGPQVPVNAPDMPDWLSADAQSEWRELVPALELLGLVATVDRFALATYCEAVGDYRKFSRLIHDFNADGHHKGDVQTFVTGAKQISVWRQLRNDAEKRANQIGAAFGLSPMARRNLRAVAAPQQGELIPNGHKEAVDKYFA